MHTFPRIEQPFHPIAHETYSGFEFVPAIGSDIPTMISMAKQALPQQAFNLHTAYNGKLAKVSTPISEMRYGNTVWVMKDKGEPFGFVWVCERGKAGPGSLHIGLKKGVISGKGRRHVSGAVGAFLSRHRDDLHTGSLIYTPPKKVPRIYAEIFSQAGFYKHPNGQFVNRPRAPVPHFEAARRLMRL